MNTRTTVVCPRCGAPVPSGSRFCSQCGDQVSLKKLVSEANTPAAAPPVQDGSVEKNIAKHREISWEVNVPLLTDQFIMYDLLKVWGISMTLVFLVMLVIFAVEGNWQSLVNVLPLLGLTALGILLLFLLVMLIFFGNRYPMGFVLSSQGAGVISLSQRGRWGNRLAVILGALAGKPGVAGAGLLALSRESVGITWDDVRRLKIHPEARVISLMDSWHVVLRLYCTPLNYDQVLSVAQIWAAKGIRKASAPRPPGLSSGQKLAIQSVLALIAALFMTALPLAVPPSVIVLVLMGGIGAVWLKPWRRIFGVATLIFASVILAIFVSQALEVRQRTDPEEFRRFAQSQGVKIDQVPDWVIGRYRRFELFHPDDWLRTGIAALGMSFFIWTGWLALRPREKKCPTQIKEKTLI